ncbi:hypothetical protein SHAM105786_15040 [Shewanella amazonensis]|uniref:Uncharacterized protein n=1 Tax=Shewanella amazonensis (strain ATCC BAA-1098 / SB2B) TaxID=326297 RepID=A1S1Y5_SHEAM|nr:hypothetical protein [Shewanella amazonensis]ABL98391.1 hypothetical protein Sama_0180 [Shewanella amazonensis SB2B]
MRKALPLLLVLIAGIAIGLLLNDQDQSANDLVSPVPASAAATAPLHSVSGQTDTVAAAIKAPHDFSHSTETNEAGTTTATVDHQQQLAAKARVCEAAYSESHCELSGVTDFGPLLLNHNGHVYIDEVSALLSANNFDVFVTWLGKGDKNERSMSVQHQLERNQDTVYQQFPDINVEPIVCDSRLCAVTIAYNNVESLRQARTQLLRNVDFNAMMESEKEPGKAKYIVFIHAGTFVSDRDSSD